MPTPEQRAAATPGFEGRLAHARAQLASAAVAHAGAIVQATSLGAEDMVITDLIARDTLPIALATLDTGLLHASTVELMDRIEHHYRLPLERHRPPAEAVVAFVERHGERSMYDSIAQRKACCALRKTGPLQALLAGRTAWVTGLRREQSDQRGEVPFSEIESTGRTKFNPLADWSWADVWHYIVSHGVPFNPLHDKGFPSIGCAPCTRPVADGEPLRAGRWWWEQEQAKECGLHVKEAAAA